MLSGLRDSLPILHTLFNGMRMGMQVGLGAYTLQLVLYSCRQMTTSGSADCSQCTAA